MATTLKIMDTITPRLISIEAMLYAFRDSLLTDDQLTKFNKAHKHYLKEFVSELVKENPRLLEETPELKAMIE